VLPFFNLTWTQNYGISLGLFKAEPISAVDIGRATSAIAVGVAYWIGREKARWDKAALGMILGGALGNILDRLRYGYVVDFADLHIGNSARFWSSMSPTQRLASASSSCYCARSWCANEQPKETVENA
jgi:signal peptidase II